MNINLKLALLVSVMGTGYYWLAVLGLGGAHAFFSHPALIALTISGVTMLIVSLFSQGNLSSGQREDRSNRWILGAFAIIGLLAGYIPAYTDRLNFLTIDGESIRWLGVALFTIGGVLRIWPVFVLGRRFSGLVAIQPGHTLVNDGIYRVIRHPSYLGLLMNELGWALCFRSGVGILLTILSLVPLLARIRSEEALLHSQFGTEYDCYRAQTPWRMIPGIF